MVPIGLLPARPTLVRKDDWFQLFDRVREESVGLPPGILSHTALHQLFITVSKFTTPTLSVSFLLWDQSGYDEEAT